MRVLHFCEFFSPLSETFIYDLVNELEGQSMDNHIATLHRENADSRPFLKAHLVKKPCRWNLQRLSTRASVALGLRDIREVCWPVLQKRLKGLVKSVAPDVVHAHFGPAGVLIAPIALRLGIPLIVSFHGFDVTRYARDEFWQRKYHELWPATAVISGVSNHICNRLQELGAPPDKIVRVSNGVKLEEFPCQNPAEHFDGKNVECLFVGRLVEKKGPLLLVKAFQTARKLVADRLNLILHVVGDGPLRPALEEYCRQEHLEACVHLYGPMDHSEVKAMMRRAHIYVQHSLTAANGDQEGQPVALIEAAATGLPCISTNHSGIPEIVLDGKTGFLVEENDFEGMGRKIALLSLDPNLWRTFGLKGRNHVESNLTQEKQVASWIERYRNVCASTRHGIRHSVNTPRAE